MNNGAAVGPQGEGMDSPSTFPKYPAYKDSGVEWLGEIPDHWQIKALRYLTICLDGKRIPLNGEQRADKQGDIPYWGANAIMDYVDEAIFDEELLLVGEDGAPFLDPYKPVAFHSSGPVWPNNHIHVLRPNKPEWVRFLVYFMNAADYANYIEGSTRQKLNQSRLMGMPVSWPSQLEQTQIARFLDHETARIDTLIEEQQRLIELLKEKRQAVISHAVTKGLDPMVPMKDSGVEWLGEVPEHWKVVPAKRGISVLTDFTANGSFAALAENVEYQSSGYARLIRMTDLRQNLETDGIWIDESAYKYLEKSSLVGGELLMASVGSVGLIYLMPEVDYPASLAPNMYLLKTNSSLLSKFLYWSLLSEGGQSQIFQVATTTAQPKLNKDNVRSIVIALPEVQEQTQIARFLDHETARIDALIEEANTGVVLLKERRSALISAAVTGKIDVRNWQPPARAQAPECEEVEVD